jgi:hypothetical protein
MVQSEDAAEAAQGVARLKRLRAFADYDRIVFVYDEEKNEGRRQRLAAAYRELTGTELENRLLILRD